MGRYESPPFDAARELRRAHTLPDLLGDTIASATRDHRQRQKNINIGRMLTDSYDFQRAQCQDEACRLLRDQLQAVRAERVHVIADHLEPMLRENLATRLEIGAMRAELSLEAQIWTAEDSGLQPVQKIRSTLDCVTTILHRMGENWMVRASQAEIDARRTEEDGRLEMVRRAERLSELTAPFFTDLVVLTQRCDTARLVLGAYIEYAGVLAGRVPEPF